MLDERAGLGDRVAVVTGGAGGLGRDITLDLARCGVRVAVCDRDQAAAEEIRHELAGSGTAALVDVFDVRDAVALAGFFDRVDAELGAVDILINVPGGSFMAPVADLSSNAVAAVVAQNFGYVLESCRLARSRMAARGRGSIVNVSSIEAHRAMPMMGIYGAMKAAVEHLTKTLAVEWGPEGIRVNAVAPDIFPTPATEHQFGLAHGAELNDLDASIVVPLGRFGAGPELSGCVVFLASDLAAYVTGTTLHVDGGTHAASGWLRWPEGYRNRIPAEVLRTVAATTDDQRR